MRPDLSLDPVQFKAYLSDRLVNGGSDDEFDDIDSWLLGQLDRDNAQLVANCAAICVELFSASARVWPKAYALNTLILAYFECGEHALSRKALSELVTHSIDHDTPQAGLSGIDNVRERLHRFGSPDYLMHLLAEMRRFYVHFGATDLAISSTLTVAKLLADYGAFQSAYRALADAEGLARQHSRAKLLAQVLTVEASTALLDKDSAFCVKVGSMAKELYRALGEDIPFSLISNLATASMREGDHASALAGYQECLRAGGPEVPLLTNISACLRQMGDLDGADEHMRAARGYALREETDEPERYVELELVAAANAIAAVRLSEAAECLNDAVAFLDLVLSTVDKLHYRRAVRERYIRRIETMMGQLPTQGAAADVIEIVASTRCNQLTDWLHILDWADELSVQLTDDERAALANSISRLANFGAPYLQGYLEKYNDPLAQDIMPDPWREFSELAKQFADRHNFRHALVTSCIANAADLIHRRLAEGYALLFVLTTGGGKALLLVGDQYHFCDLPIDQTAAFGQSLHAHRENTARPQEFNKVLNQYQSALLSSFDSVLPLLVADECRGLILFPDRFDLLTANLLACGHPPLQQRMASGEFSVRTCVAIYPCKASVTLPTKPLALLEEPTNLQLPRAQFDSFCTVLGLPGKALVNATSAQLTAAMEDTDTLILAQHGMPIGMFADPAFANTQGAMDTGIYFDTIQRSAYRWPHRLVMLSACHSGGLISRNAQRDFDSHELAGYTSIFLTNRQSVATGAAWATLDRFDYLLSTRFAIELGHGTEPSRAFSIALGDLITMPATDAMRLFEHIADPLLKDKMNPTNSDKALAHLELMKQQPFCYGAYQLVTLL